MQSENCLVHICLSKSLEFYLFCPLASLSIVPSFFCVSAILALYKIAWLHGFMPRQNKRFAGKYNYVYVVALSSV